jgi:hypothetical protein
MHAGQIIMLTKMMTSDDLRFYEFDAGVPVVHCGALNPPLDPKRAKVGSCCSFLHQVALHTTQLMG